MYFVAHYKDMENDVMKDDYRQLLSDYLEHILRDPQTAALEVDKLEEPYRKLGKDIQALHSHLLFLSDQAKQATGYGELLAELTRSKQEWILLTDPWSGEILYCNRRSDKADQSSHQCETCGCRLQFLDEIRRWTDDPITAEMEDDAGRIYQVSNHSIDWQGRSAYAHIITDITDRKKQTQRLNRKAYLDPSLGIYNRLFFKEYMTSVLNGRTLVTLCYMDLDGLKFVNDHFGHSEGDVYLSNFVSAVQNHVRSGDILARIGGDEFCLILPSCPLDIANEKMETIRNTFIKENVREYPASFSYGALEINEDSNYTLGEIIEKADSIMYEYKRKHKTERQA